MPEEAFANEPSIIELELQKADLMNENVRIFSEKNANKNGKRACSARRGESRDECGPAACCPVGTLPGALYLEI